MGFYLALGASITTAAAALHLTRSCFAKQPNTTHSSMVQIVLLVAAGLATVLQLTHKRPSAADLLQLALSCAYLLAGHSHTWTKAGAWLLLLARSAMLLLSSPASVVSAASSLVSFLAWCADGLFVVLLVLLHLTQPAQMFGLAQLVDSLMSARKGAPDSRQQPKPDQGPNSSSARTMYHQIHRAVELHVRLCRVAWFVAAITSLAQLAQLLGLSSPASRGASATILTSGSTGSGSAWLALQVVGAVCRLTSSAVGVVPSRVVLTLPQQYLLDLLGSATALVGFTGSAMTLAARVGSRAAAAVVQLVTIAAWVHAWLDGRDEL